MATKTVSFNAAKHLKSRRAQAELLADALETGDAGYIANALGVIAQARASEKTDFAERLRSG